MSFTNFTESPFLNTLSRLRKSIVQKQLTAFNHFHLKCVTGFWLRPWFWIYFTGAEVFSKIQRHPKLCPNHSHFHHVLILWCAVRQNWKEANFFGISCRRHSRLRPHSSCRHFQLTGTCIVCSKFYKWLWRRLHWLGNVGYELLGRCDIKG